jgi:hypothetical protein
MEAFSAAAAQFTRPADTTAYAAGDLVANSTTAGSVVALTFTFGALKQAAIEIRRFKIRKSNTTITNGSFRLHLFTAIPTFTSAGDNSAIGTVAQGAANWLGSLDCGLTIALQDGAVGEGIPVSNTLGHAEIVAQFAEGATPVLYGFLEARAAYTPTSAETFNITLYGAPVVT